MVLYLGLRFAPTTIYSCLVKSLMSDLEVDPTKKKVSTVGFAMIETYFYFCVMWTVRAMLIF